MYDLARRRSDMFGRVKVFGAESAADFPAGSAGATNFAIINEVVGGIEASGAMQMSGWSSGSQHTFLRSVARANVFDDLRAFNRTALALSIDHPGMKEKFRMPRGDNDQVLLASARSFLTDAEPFKALFIEYGMPTDCLEDLADDIAALETAIDNQSESTDTSVAATAELDALIERGVNAVRRLRAIVVNRYANDSGKLAAWVSASHVEKAPKKKPEAPTGETEEPTE